MGAVCGGLLISTVLLDLVDLLLLISIVFFGLVVLVVLRAVVVVVRGLETVFLLTVGAPFLGVVFFAVVLELLFVFGFDGLKSPLLLPKSCPKA